MTLNLVKITGACFPQRLQGSCYCNASHDIMQKLIALNSITEIPFLDFLLTDSLLCLPLHVIGIPKLWEN